MTDDALNWADSRNTLTKVYGEPPGPQLEADIIDAFEKNPQAVINAASEVADAYINGDIRSGWPILRKRVERINQPLRDVTVPRPDARAKAISRAEQWIKNAGIHYDTATEVEDELFGDRGSLRDWHQSEGPDNRPQDEALRDRFLELWRQARPIGEQLEADLEQRSEHWKATTGVLWNERVKRRLEQEAAQTTAELITETLNTDLPAELQPQETA